MKIKNVFVVFYFLFIIFFGYSCSIENKSIKNNQTKEDTQSSITDKAPDWLENYKIEDSNYYYFVGSSSEVTTENEGDKQSLEDIYRKVFSLIGLNVSSSFEKSEVYKNSDNKEEFNSVLKSLLKTSSKGKIKDIKILDRYIKKLNNDKIIVYIYVSIPKSVIKAEQLRLEKLYEEKINSFVLPEQKAKKALVEGDIYSSFYNTIISIKNVISTDYENKNVIISRGIDRLYFLTSNLKANLIFNNEKLIRGEKQENPFIYKIIFNYNEKAIPVTNLPVKFFYQDLNTKGEITSYEYNTNTNNEGNAIFKYDAIPFSGKTYIIAFVNIIDQINSLLTAINSDEVLSSDLKMLYVKKLKSIKDNLKGLKIKKDIVFLSKTLSLKTVVIYNFIGFEDKIIKNVNVSSFDEYLTSLNVPFIAKNIDIGLSNNIDNYIDKVKTGYLKNGYKRIIVIKGDVSLFKKYGSKIIASTNIVVKIYYFDTNIVKTISVKATGNGEDKLKAINNSYFNGLKKLQQKLLLYL